MLEAVNQSEHYQAPWASNYPALSALGFTEEEFEQLRTQGEAKFEELRANAKDIEEQVLATVREKPITSLAIAAGVGFLFALIARR